MKARGSCAVLLSAILVTACGALPLVSADPRYDLHVENGTTLPVAIEINGTTRAQVQAGSTLVVSLTHEPAGIVRIAAQLPDGRPAVTFAIDPATLGSTTV